MAAAFYVLSIFRLTNASRHACMAGHSMSYQSWHTQPSKTAFMATAFYVLSILANTSFETCIHGHGILCRINLGKHKL